MPPLLSPDSKRFKSVGLLRQSQLKLVTLVEDLETSNQYVAYLLKTPSTLAKEQAALRFAAEAAALQGLSHPGIPRFEGYLSTATGNWFLFEHLPGFPLSQYKGCVERISTEWALWWFAKILGMLLQFHKRDVLVGGFEPKHLLVNEAQLSLVHVGVLENLFPETLALLRSPERLTYTAPEHRHSIQTSVTGDLYSAGAIAHWLCSGKPPLYGSHVPHEKVLAAIRELRPDFPDEVAQIITKLIQFQHQNRFEQASEALKLLTPFLPGPPETVPPVPERPYTVRFFGRETSARLTFATEELEKKESEQTPQSSPIDAKTMAPVPAKSSAGPVNAETGMMPSYPLAGPLSQATMRPLTPSKPKNALEVDTDKLSHSAMATVVAKDVQAILATPSGNAAGESLDSAVESFRRSPLQASLVLIGGLAGIILLVYWVLH